MTTAADARCAIVVFAKAPEPGKVKTRLVPELGEAGAAALHRRLVARTLAVAGEAGLGPVELWCAPDDRHPFFAECVRCFGASLHSQGGGDLGARMHRAFERTLARSGRALLIGCDVPAISPQYLRAAERELARCDVAIGPAEDGGYVLIGLSRTDPGLFREIPWGGPGVLAETRRRIAALRWRSSELPALWDLDRPEDLDRVPGAMPENIARAEGLR